MFYDLGIRSKAVIGREASCDIVIHDSMSSRRHCEVHGMGSGGFVVADLRSKNGTTVNGAPISSWTLKDGDLISIGSTTFLYLLHK